MFFIQKTFFVELWKNDQLIISKTIENASKDLLFNIDQILDYTRISMNNINKFAALSGPGSFSNIRISYSTICALKRVFPNIQYSTYYFHELINDPTNLLIRLNNNIFLVFKNEWEVVLKKNLHKNIDYKIFSAESCTKTFQDLIDEGNQLKSIKNIGKHINQKILNENNNTVKNDSNIKHPLYIYMPVTK